MRLRFIAAFWLLFSLAASASADIPHVGPLTLDPKNTFRVRDLQLKRGAVKFYLTEGVVSFFEPVQGRIVGGVFSTTESESGDGELLVLPPIRSERASLASFTGSPNLDEHIKAAVLFFSDDTAAELHRQIQAGVVREAPELVRLLTDQFAGSLSQAGSRIEFRLIETLLDLHQPKEGFFYGAFFGRTLGQFNFIFDPETFEPVTLGRGVVNPDGTSNFEVWASFQPNTLQANTAPPNRYRNYRIATTIHPDLSLNAQADFDFDVPSSAGRVLRFDLSDHLRVLDASVDGVPAEVLQRTALLTEDARVGGSFLTISSVPLSSGWHHICVRYSGQVIRHNATGTYFVDDRTDWFPQSPGLLSSFDLTFRCPSDLNLVSTGEPVADEVNNGFRTIHRVSTLPRPYAGFNLGRYREASTEAGPYRIQIYRNAAERAGREDLPAESARILNFYTSLWSQVPIHTLAISPIGGYFGQGFPGLVYLSEAAFRRPEDRTPQERTDRYSNFLSLMLLPHEIAHQWWGNLLFSSNYRSGWLMEALASDSAIRYVERQAGPAAAQKLLDEFRTDLLSRRKDGRTIESTGSLDWGFRLLESSNPEAWQPIVYGKGTWVLRMLRKRMGDRSFEELERQLLRRFSQRSVTNEDIRQLAAELTPASVPTNDRDYLQFFDTWVFSTGIPRLGLIHPGGEWELTVGGVEEDFTVDVPITCVARNGTETVWVRAAKGENPLPGGGTRFRTCALPPSDSYLFVYSHNQY